MTGKLVSNRKVTKTSEQSLILNPKLIALTFFIIPPENTLPR